ncbi:MAG TPA: hypothetical protein VGJ77_01115 [Gaiellaceae bacterium]
MRVVVGALLLALAAGCGGKSKPLAEKARPIAPTNTIPPLPVLDPDFRPSPARLTQNLAWSDELEEYGEVSYSSRGAGANAVQSTAASTPEIVLQDDPESLRRRIRARVA